MIQKANLKYALLGAAALTLWFNAPFVAAVTYSLRVSTVISEVDPLYKGYQRFAEAVEKRTNGDMAVEVFPNAWGTCVAGNHPRTRRKSRCRHPTQRRQLQSPVFSWPGASVMHSRRPPC